MIVIVIVKQKWRASFPRCFTCLPGHRVKAMAAHVRHLLEGSIEERGFDGCHVENAPKSVELPAVGVETLASRNKAYSSFSTGHLAGVSRCLHSAGRAFSTVAASFLAAWLGDATNNGFSFHSSYVTAPRFLVARRVNDHSRKRAKNAIDEATPPQTALHSPSNQFFTV